MIRVPRIPSGYRSLVRERASSALLGPDRYAVIEGALARCILDVVDGRVSADDIAEALAEDFGAARVYYTLLLLESEGLLEEGAAGDPAPAPRDRRGGSRGGGQAGEPPRSGSLRTSPAARPNGTPPGRGGVVVRVTEDARERCRDVLERVAAAWDTLPPIAIGNGRAGDDESARVRGVLGIATSYLDPEIRVWWQEAGDLARPLLLLALRDGDLWVGPELVPGSGPCLICLRDWLDGTQAHARVPQAGVSTVRDLPVRDPSFSDELVSGALGAIRDWAVGSGPSPLRGLLQRWTEGGGEPETHPVLPRPDCVACGTPARTLGPPRLATRPKHGAARGGFRIEPPERTFIRLRKYVSPIVGAVRHVTRVEGPDLIHTYTSSHAYPVETPGLRTLKTTSRDRCGGKGTTDIEARVSALCEALERYSAVYRGTELRVFGTGRQLGADGVDPRTILGFSETQYAERESWNAGPTGRFHAVPTPYDRRRWMSWTPVWSLTRFETRFVPTSLCYFGYAGPGEEVARADSNGLAAGNCLEEAIVQAFLELVERDAVALWWYNRTNPPELALQGVADPFVQGIARLYDRLERRLWVLDLTSDLEIPVFAAVSATGDGSRIIMGFGAHLDRGIALRRALCELGQALPLALASGEHRRRTLLPDHSLALHWWRNETLETQPYLVPAGVRTLDEFAAYESADLLDDVRECVVRARRVGLEVLCLDLTRPEIDLHVARVFVPGLRHFWRRLGPGRLYDVPVKLGRLAAPLAESSLNPLPMFL